MIHEHLKLAEDYFADICVLENKVNIGLAQNVTQSISYVFKEHNIIIVVEDDVITSNVF